MSHKRSQFATVALAVLGVSLLLAGCGSRQLGRPVTTPAVTSTITIDPELGETFAPPAASAAPAMTAQQAWAAYTQVNTSYSTPAIPSEVTVQLGLFTLPLGPSGPNGTEAYTAHDELAYGFSWHSCPVSRNPNEKTFPANPCVEWNFLDANTGHQIQEGWQWDS
jgi:hypothetical protein